MTHFPPIETVYESATLKELAIALNEIGEIQPTYDDEVKAWIFTNALYPTVESEGETQQECTQRYPFWLAEFLKHRLNANISSQDEQKTLGRGGKRYGAGRPSGTIKSPKTRISLDVRLALLLKNNPENQLKALKALEG